MLAEAWTKRGIFGMLAQDTMQSNYRVRLIRSIDNLTTRLRVELSTPQRIALFAGLYLFYVIAVVMLVDHIGISTNYFIFIPMIAAAGLFGWYGGVVFGALALPSNMLLYYLLGTLSAAPEHPQVAWIAGIITGIVLGYFSEYFFRLQQATDENRMLVRELHHRVKNNLGIISGLIQYHSNAVVDPDAQRHLQQLKRRVHSIANVHDKLYPRDTRTISASVYLRDLVHDIEDSLVGDYQQVRFDLDLEPLELEPDVLMSIGLITNEFITNSLEHAFPGGQGEIRLSLQQKGGDTILELHDDGCGLPNGFSVDETRTLGFPLMRSLAGRVRGRMEIDGRPGTGIRVRFSGQSS